MATLAFHNNRGSLTTIFIYIDSLHILNENILLLQDANKII